MGGVGFTCGLHSMYFEVLWCSLNYKPPDKWYLNSCRFSPMRRKENSMMHMEKMDSKRVTTAHTMISSPGIHFGIGDTLIQG